MHESKRLKGWLNWQGHEVHKFGQKDAPPSRLEFFGLQWTTQLFGLAAENAYV